MDVSTKTEETPTPVSIRCVRTRPDNKETSEWPQAKDLMLMPAAYALAPPSRWLVRLRY